jgi:hypothetical protein
LNNKKEGGAKKKKEENEENWYEIKNQWLVYLVNR